MRVSRVLLGVLILVSCSGTGEQTETTSLPTSGADTPIGAVEALVAAIEEGEFETSDTYTVPYDTQLASLVEGASLSDVADALREGESDTEANFWAGFAQGAGTFLAGSMTVVEGDRTTQEGVEFDEIRVLSSDGGDRSVWVRDVGGFRVDVFASFGAGLADKMLAPVERLLGTQTEDSQLILSRLRGVVPSLLVSAESPEITVESRQQILALVELITRVD